MDPGSHHHYHRYLHPGACLRCGLVPVCVYKLCQWLVFYFMFKTLTTQIEEERKQTKGDKS